MISKQRSRALGSWLWMFLVMAPSGAWAAGLPRLLAIPQQERVRAWLGPLPVWDTTWWLAVTATAEGAPVCRINYSARFTDSADARQLTGSFDFDVQSGASRGGRIALRCATRVDYDRRLRVRLQAETCDGTKSAWSDSQFPVDDAADAIMPQKSEAGASAAAPAGVEVVTADAGADTTLGEVRAALDRAARARGATAATHLRIVDSTAERVRFAADAVLVPAPPPVETTPAARESPEADLLGEIVMQPARH